MNDTFQHEFDDELLSAYLDDELSAEERAVVEARLEADPAAQQLLEQLRAASQAVQRLPQETLGRDLTEVVLQRVAAGKLPLPKGEGSERELPMPRLTIGRTQRGWVWAALAIAAALLLMFVQSDDDQNNKLPAVAKRDNDNQKIASDDRLLRRQLGNEPTISPAPESAAREPAAPDGLAAENAPTSAAAAPAEAFYDKSLVSEATAAKPDSGSGPETINGQARGTPLAANELAKERSVEFSGGAPEGALADSKRESLAEGIDELKQNAPVAAAPFGGAKAELPSDGRSSSVSTRSDELSPDDESLIVVNVVAKSEAIGKKTFDKILNDNGVFFDSDAVAASDEPGFAGGRFAKPPQPARSAESGERSAGEASAGDAIDAVLVEAPPQIIASCVEKLNEDHDNYVGLDVEESQSFDRSDKSVALETEAAKITPSKQLATDLSRYRRGIVTPQQKQLAAADQRRLGVARDRQVGEYRFDEGGGVGGAVGGSEIQTKPQSGQAMDRKDALVQNFGRAQRLLVERGEGQENEERGRAKLRSGGGEEKILLERDGSQRKLKKLAQSGTDNVKVLFYFWPESPEAVAAPSPPAENPPK